MGNGFKFGKTSKARLGTCHPRIRHWLGLAMRDTPLDFGIVCGYRGKDEQMTAFANGKSHAKYGESLHNFMWGDKPCSLAVDVLPYSAEQRDYLYNDETAILKLHHHLRMVAQGIGLNLTWGGSFNNLDDPAHWEIKL